MRRGARIGGEALNDLGDKKRFIAAVAAIVIVSSVVVFVCRGHTHTPSAGPVSPRVVLIGLDGASWNILDPLLAAGRLPHLAALLRRGVTADMQTVEPLDSPEQWTSIGTGRSPAAHGVTNFYATWDSIRVPTVWERLAARGVRVGLYDYLVTWPPRQLKGGFVIPGWTRRDAAVEPPDVYTRAGITPYVYSVEQLGTRHAAVNIAQSELREKAAHWNRLASAFEIDVGAVTFYSFDLLSHRYWRATTSGDPSVLRDTALQVDRAVGEIVDHLDPRTAVIVLSDHGFRARPEGVAKRWAFHVRQWLALGGVPIARGGFLTLNDWKEIVIRVDSSNDGAATAARLRDLFASARDAAGKPLFRTALMRSPADVRKEGMTLAFGEPLRGALPYAYLVARPVDVGRWESVCPNGAIHVRDRVAPCSELAFEEEFTGLHDPTAVFFAAGGPIRHLPRRLRVHILDVTPLIFYLAGQPIPNDLEGRLPERMLDPDFLLHNPPMRVDAGHQRGQGSAREMPYDSELERRLRSLGYVQ